MGHIGPNSPHQTSDSALRLFPLLQHLLVCPVFRPVAVSDALIADLAAYLAASASTSVSDLAGIEDFQVNLSLLLVVLGQGHTVHPTHVPIYCVFNQSFQKEG